MIRAANKGAFGYIGSIPESYWYEDYYFGVGAFSYVAQTVQGGTVPFCIYFFLMGIHNSQNTFDSLSKYNS